MGDKLGLYRAMAGAGPLTPTELAERTGTAERYVREWLNAQAAGGYVEYDPATRPLHPAARAGGGAHRRGQPGLPAGVLPDRARDGASTRRGSPRRPAPATASAGTSTSRRARRAASASSGPATTPTWSRRGCRRSTASSRSSSAGAQVADVGCGHGASTILMARGLPELDVRRLRLPRRARSRRRGSGPRRPASPTACTFEVAPAAGATPARGTTW